MTTNGPRPALPWYRRRPRPVLLVVLALAGLAFLIDHWTHVAPWLPWAILLACPLMHIFMHHGHGGHGGGKNTESSAQMDAEKPDESDQNRNG